MRAAFNASAFHTGWYFPESLRTSDVLQMPRGEVPEMAEYLAMVEEGLKAVHTEANGSQSVATAPVDIVDNHHVWRTELRPASERTAR